MNDKTDKNEPGRFLGEGVSFRAKLIGVLEVPEARGDRMCQEALADLKMAIRAAGEHKQRIQVHVAIDGLRLRDDKTGDSLYHHPVHKISFIAQDMTDSRAFGYIFGSPDTGHRFFGIKTDKAASQVVIAMRDLFQVVFELKKKEVEMAKQQLEGKSVSSNLARHIVSAVAEPKVKTITTASETSASAKTTDAGAEGGVAELVDLEQELCSLRRGLTQVEGLTPSTDPFGDSFIVPSTQKGLLPPPPSGASTRGRNTPATRTFSPTNATVTKQTLPFDLPSTTEFDTPHSLVDNLAHHEPMELKNPPKKVLKDLVPTTQSENVSSEPKDHYGPATTMTSLSRHSGGSVTIAKPPGAFGANFFSADPFAETDPFDSADPFSESFKEDPFSNVHEFPKSFAKDEPKGRRERDGNDKPVENGKVFNGPLQVSLPPEPAPRSPRLQRQGTDSSKVRQRPQGRLTTEPPSPPPPLPPKKCVEVGGKPPPRPPLEHDEEEPPPLPRPARKKEPKADRSMKPRLSSAATNSSEEEYLTPVPPPLPVARRFDITLSQLLTCTMDELANRLRVPATTLSSMTLPQLTEYLRSYLAADNERAYIHIEPTSHVDRIKPISSLSSNTPTSSIDRPPPSAPPLPANYTIPSEFKPQFEDNFTPPVEAGGAFVANFDDFDTKANASYDRYAAFREIQEQELKAKSLLDPIENDPKHDSDEKEELASIEDIGEDQEVEEKETSRSPIKSLDELRLDSFNMFRDSVSPKPSQIDVKIEDMMCVMKNLRIETAKRSVTPRDERNIDFKQEDTNDRYAALREITITEPPQDEFESLPPEIPKERKKSDEKSDGFDNSDFFDCIDNSSLSFTHVEDAFRKSPSVKEREERKVDEVKEVQVELAPVRDLEPPTRLSTGSISDVVSGSSPDTKVQSSSSSRDVSPWDEEPVSRLPRPSSHHRDRESSRHGSSGSRECLDSGSGREKDRRRDVPRERRTRPRDARDGRGRLPPWERDNYRDRNYRDSKSRERQKDYRDKDRDRHRKPRHSYDEEEDYSEGCGSGRSAGRARWRHDNYGERNYGSLAWRDSRRHTDNTHHLPHDTRYGSTLPWTGGGRRQRREERERDRDRTDRERPERERSDRERSDRERSDREARRRPKREDTRRRDNYRFSNDFSPREQTSPFDNEFTDIPPTQPKKRAPYSSLEGTRFAFESEEVTASPMSVSSARARDGDSAATRFRFDSDSISPRSMFEDDFTAPPRTRTASIAEEDELPLPPLRGRPVHHRDIKKSESINIFTRESDPFEGDAFFACTGSDRAARRENWPGDFQGFDNA